MVEQAFIGAPDIHFQLEKIQGQPGPQLEISSKEAWKKTYFIGR